MSLFVKNSNGASLSIIPYFNNLLMSLKLKKELYGCPFLEIKPKHL